MTAASALKRLTGKVRRQQIAEAAPAIAAATARPLRRAGAAPGTPLRRHGELPALGLAEEARAARPGGSRAGPTASGPGVERRARR